MPLQRTIDNSGKQLTLRTRQGADLRYRLRAWNKSVTPKAPLDLVAHGYEVVARVRNGAEVLPVPTEVATSYITLHFDSALTAKLSGPCNFAIELHRSGNVTPFAYGQITCERAL